MSQRRSKYPAEFRRQALEKLKTCTNVSQLARDLGIRRKWLYEWRDAAEGEHPLEAEVESRGTAERQPGKPKPSPTAKEAQLERQLQQLQAVVARQAMDLDFFKGALQRIEGRRRKREQTSAAASTSKSSS